MNSMNLKFGDVTVRGSPTCSDHHYVKKIIFSLDYCFLPIFSISVVLFNIVCHLLMSCHNFSLIISVPCTLYLLTLKIHHYKSNSMNSFNLIKKIWKNSIVQDPRTSFDKMNEWNHWIQSLITKAKIPLVPTWNSLWIWYKGLNYKLLVWNDEERAHECHPENGNYTINLLLLCTRLETVMLTQRYFPAHQYFRHCSITFKADSWLLF